MLTSAHAGTRRPGRPESRPLFGRSFAPGTVDGPELETLLSTQAAGGAWLQLVTETDKRTRKPPEKNPKVCDTRNTEVNATTSNTNRDARAVGQILPSLETANSSVSVDVD